MERESKNEKVAAEKAQNVLKKNFWLEKYRVIQETAFFSLPLANLKKQIFGSVIFRKLVSGYFDVSDMADEKKIEFPDCHDNAKTEHSNNPAALPVLHSMYSEDLNTLHASADSIVMPTIWIFFRSVRRKL